MAIDYNAINFKNKDIDKFSAKFGGDNGDPKKNKVETKDFQGTEYRPWKDYSGKRNIFGQEKSRATTFEVDDKGNEIVTTTNTKSISPNRTAVVGPGRAISSKSRGSDHTYYTQKTKVKTVKNKNLDEFLEKNPDFKVTDGTLKTKKRTQTHLIEKGEYVKRKNLAPPLYTQPMEEVKKNQPSENNTSKPKGGGKHSFRDRQLQYEWTTPTSKEKIEETTTRGDVANARASKVKNLIGIRTNKVKK